jgi:hypothetical protein
MGHPLRKRYSWELTPEDDSWSVAVIKQAEETLSSFDGENAREIGKGGEVAERPVALMWKSGEIGDRVWLLWFELIVD